MPLNANYILVEKVVEEEKEGEFKAVKVVNDDIYKGRVVKVPMCPVYVDSHLLSVGDVVIFAPNSPDTHRIEDLKYIKSCDILEVL